MKKVGAAIGVVCAIALTWSVGQKALGYLSDMEPAVHAGLEMASEEMNESLPRIIEEGVELTNTVADGSTLIYNYRITDFPASELEAQPIQDSRPAVAVQVCTSPDTKELLRRKDVTFRFNYHGKDGGFLTTFDIAPEDCAFDVL